MVLSKPVTDPHYTGCINVNERTNQNDRLGHARNLLGRYRWRFMLASLGAALVVLGVSLVLPRKFEAEAIFERRSDLIMHELTSRGRVSDMNNPVRRTARVDLTSRAAIMQVIEELDLLEGSSGYASHEHTQRELVSQLRRNLRVSVDLATGSLERIRLTLVDENPKRAQAVVNRLVENYIEENERQLKKSMEDAAAFFREQRSTCEQRIDTLEEQRVRFELEHADLLPDESASLQQRISDTELQVLEARQQKEAADRWVETLESQLNEKQNQPETTTSLVMKPNPQIAEIDMRLKKHMADLDNMITMRRMTPSHPAVQSLKDKIAELQKIRATLPTEVVSERMVSPVLAAQELQMKLAEARSRANGAADAVALAEQQLTKFNEINADMYPVRSAYRRLDRSILDVQHQIDFWDDNLRRVEMVLVAESGQRGVNMQFTHPCGELRVPSSPDLAQVLFAAIGAAGVVGVLTLLISDRTERSFTDMQEPSRELGLPILGATGELITNRAVRWRGFSHRVLYPTCVALMLVILAGASYMTYVGLRTPQTSQSIWLRAFKQLVSDPNSADAETKLTQSSDSLTDASGDASGEF